MKRRKRKKGEESRIGAERIREESRMTKRTTEAQSPRYTGQIRGLGAWIGWMGG